MKEVLLSFINFTKSSSDSRCLNDAIKACYSSILSNPENFFVYKLLGDLFSYSQSENKSKRCNQIQSKYQEIEIEYFLEAYGDYLQEIGDLNAALFAYQVALYYNNNYLAPLHKISSLVFKSDISLNLENNLMSNAVELLSPPLVQRLHLEIANHQIINNNLWAAQRSYIHAFFEKPTVLFFAPEGGIAPHFSMHCVLAKILDDLGHSIAIARCPGLFPRCPALDMHRLIPEQLDLARQQICANCISTGNQMIEAYGLASVNMAAFYTEDLIRKHKNALSILPKNLIDFQFEKIHFGRLCFLEIALIKKQHDTSIIDDETRQYWIDLISSSLLSYLIIDYICQVLPISRIVYYDDYSLMIGARLAAKKHSLPAFRVLHTSHKTVDRSRYTIMPSVALAGISKIVDTWTQWRDLALLPELIQEVANDSRIRLLGKSVFVYSPAKTLDISNLYQALNLSDSKKLLVAYTSSVDEIVSLRLSADALGVTLDQTPQPFKDQIHWLRCLIHYVESRHDLQLVVRVHPRTGKNKRDSKVSQFLDQMISEFQDKFQNCQFIWPESPISSYDLAEIANVGLIAWSSIGLEMARLGVPVLAAYRNIEYFPECIAWENSKEKYFGCLEKLLVDKPSLERVRLAYSWYTLRVLAASVDLGDLIPDSNFSGLPQYTMPRLAQDIEDTLIREKHLIDVNFSKLKRQQKPESKDLELQTLASELQKTIHFLFTGEIPENKNFSIVFLNNVFQNNFKNELLNANQLRETFDSHCKKLNPGENKNFAVTFQNVSYYFHDYCTYFKKSLMLERLIAMCST